LKTHNYKITIDEICYLTCWQIRLKIDADINQKTLYLISESSAMQLKKISQDLSRILDYYKLNPLSFKEFLKIKKIK
jgi:predicted AAA+ superfamily ATPase